MAERDAQRSPPSRRDIAGEDFLFHLYRGSEMLQDNRVHDAKAELEQALALQPSDPKGQDLLGIVYFRLGLYPRAITIYEQLIRQHPDAVEPRINLALSYLKTGQPGQARFELEKVVEQNPGHSRAWAYLGLAFQRLGDYERASYAFQTGGHDGMARRLTEMTAAGGAFTVHPAGDLGAAPPPSIPRAAGVPAEAEAAPPELVPSIAPAPPVPTEAVAPAPASRRLSASPPRRPGEAVREALLVFPRDLPVSRHPSGLVLVQATAGFAVRLEAIRSLAYAAGQQSTVLLRKTRGRVLDEPLGGAASPVCELVGKVELALGAAAGHRLWPIVLEDEMVYLREDALAGFEAVVGYENGRLPVGDGDSIPMVQLRGKGTVVAEVPETVAALEVTEGRSTAVRAVSVLGWVGRVVPRGLLPHEAPGGLKGLVTFAGEGMVLVDGR